MADQEFRMGDISLRWMARILLCRWHLIAAAALICALAAFVWQNWFHLPVYRGTLTYSVVSREDGSVSADTLPARTQAAATIAELLECTPVINALTQSLGQEPDWTLKASRNGDTNLITVTVSAASREQVSLVLDTLQEIFPRFSLQFSPHYWAVPELDSLRIEAQPAGGGVSAKLCITRGMFGGIAMAGILCWLHLRRDTLQTVSAARHRLDAPILCILEARHPRGWGQIGDLCARMIFEQKQHGSRVFLFVQMRPEEGADILAEAAGKHLAKQGYLISHSRPHPGDRTIFDFILLTGTPADTAAESADASLLIVRRDHTPARALNAGIQDLYQRGAFLGCVWNAMEGGMPYGN